MNRLRSDYLAFGQPALGPREFAAVRRVMATGWIGMGPETMAFERELAAATNAPDVVTVNSCTSALFLALLASGVKPGDEVICPSFTWCSTANAVLYLGARPVFCDIDSQTFNATPATVRAMLTRRTRAVLLVHMGGLAIDVAAVRAVLPRRVKIVEDAAHALGARYPDGRPVGSSGNLTCFSFYANKNLSTGEGGAIAVTDERTAAKLRSLRLHGLDADAWKRYAEPVRAVRVSVKELGYKMNYTDLQAAIGRVQLARQPTFSAVRYRVAQIYQRWIAQNSYGIVAQAGLTDAGHARHLFQIVLPARLRGKRRDEVVVSLRDRRIGASIHYHPVHRYKPYRPYVSAALPITDEIAARVMTLPIGPRMRQPDAKYVLSHLEDVIEDMGR